MKRHDFNIRNVDIDKLDDIMNENKNTYHRTIEMKPVIVKIANYAECSANSNDKDPKFQVVVHVKMQKDMDILLLVMLM